MTKKEFIEKKQKIAEEIFASARKLEELHDDARTEWENPSITEDESAYWSDMQYFLEDQTSILDGVYSELDQENSDDNYDEDDDLLEGIDFDELEDDDEY